MGFIQPWFALWQQYIEQYLEVNNKKYTDIEMLELGNQWFWEKDLTDKMGRVAKPYWESLGIKHTSIDTNGEDKAIILDLGKPLPEEYFNKYDILSNAGTAEHVYNQYECWKNMHKCLKVGGYNITLYPEKGFPPGHCDWYIDENFIEKFAEKLNYKTWYLERIWDGKQCGGWLITCILEKKEDSDFNFTEAELNSLLFDNSYIKPIDEGK